MRNQYFLDGKSNLYILEDSGHQMAIDNPVQLAKLIIDDIAGVSCHVFQPALPTWTYLDSNGEILPEDEHDEVLLENRVL